MWVRDFFKQIEMFELFLIVAVIQWQLGSLFYVWGPQMAVYILRLTSLVYFLWLC